MNIFIFILLLFQVVPGISTSDKDINQTVTYSILTNGDKFVIDKKTGKTTIINTV